MYGDIFTEPNKPNKDGVKRGFFRLLTNTRCTRLCPKSTLVQSKNMEIAFVSVRSPMFPMIPLLNRSCREVQDLLGARLHGTAEPPETNFSIVAKVIFFI